MTLFTRLAVLFICSFAIVPAALATKLTALGSVVKLTTDEMAVSGCELKGEIASRPPYVMPDDWQVQLRNAAGDLGANAVLHKKPGVGNVKGTAYLCPEPPPASAGCAKDTDCKGDRICDAGVCKAP
jgi:hypothetical protein